MWGAPLEQFEVYLIWRTFFCSAFLSNSNLYVALSFSFLVWLFCFNRVLLIPTRLQQMIDSAISFVSSLVYTNIGFNLQRFLSYFVTLFFIVLSLNLIGMVPYTFTVTSHLVFTFFLSFLTFFAVNWLGIIFNGFRFFGLFLPNGAPYLLSPFLIFIEILSYIARVFSLAIRLFANLMAGHTLLKILSEFGWSLLHSLGVGLVLFILPLLLIFAITGLEIAIAGLQAYVFLILSCIYLSDAVFLH